jgi:hypothetical protein
MATAVACRTCWCEVLPLEKAEYDRLRADHLYAGSAGERLRAKMELSRWAHDTERRIREGRQLTLEIT